MKNYINIFLALASIGLFVACAPESAKSEDTSLAGLESRRDSLRTLAADLSTQIQMLETSITAQKESLGLTKIFQVKTTQLERGTFEHYIKTQGAVNADKSIMLNAENSGSVRTIHVSEGAYVSAGKILISLDTDILNNSMKELETAYELASVIFQKQEKLWKQNIGSEIEFLQAKNKKESLETQLATLKARKAKSIIRAPFAGTVDAIMPKMGESVAPGMPVVRLINNRVVKIESEISERYVGAIKKGSKLLVTTPQSNEPLELKLDYIGSYINPANRTFKVSSKVNNRSGALLPNMVADMAIRDYINKDAVVVPNKAILEDLNGSFYVYTVKQDGDLEKVEHKRITLGKSYNGTTEVLSGLRGSETLIIEGAKSVNPGDVITVMQ
jgi:RND family efflux transporter MFP subunit